MPLTEEQKRERKQRISRVVGHAFAALSLLGCLSFWVEMGYNRWESIRVIDHVGWSPVMYGSLALAILAACLRSKLWRVAVPVSILMLMLTI